MDPTTFESGVFSNTTLRRVFVYIVDAYVRDIVLDDIASVSGQSKFELCRLFRRSILTSPMRFLWLYRVMLATEMIHAADDRPLSKIATAIGFKSSAHFSRAFRKVHAMSPKDYRIRCRFYSQLPAGQVFSGEPSEEIRTAALIRALKSTQTDQKSVV
jgi:AraC-like DNA-binding protein